MGCFLNRNSKSLEFNLVYEFIVMLFSFLIHRRHFFREREPLVERETENKKPIKLSSICKVSDGTRLKQTMSNTVKMKSKKANLLKLPLLQQNVIVPGKVFETITQHCSK